MEDPGRPQRDQITILCVLGFGRSGSTVFEASLSARSGVPALGELTYFWERGVLGNMLCSCGKPFHDCGFWRRVMDGIGGADHAGKLGHEMMALRRSVERYRHAFWYVLPWLRSRSFHAAARRWAEINGALYESVRKATGSNVLLDSSKDYQHYFHLSQMPNLSVIPLHFVRDARAVAYSWGKLKERPEIHWEKAYMPRFSPLRSAFLWSWINFWCGVLGRRSQRYQFLTYEAFVADPEAALRDIEDACGLQREAQLPQRDIHSVSGNPCRFDFHQGTLQIRSDDEWRSRFRWHQRLACWIVSWPLMLRYYGLGRRCHTRTNS